MSLRLRALGILLLGTALLLTASCKRLSVSAFNSGNAKESSGDYDGAIAAYSRAIALEPQNSRAWNNRGIAKQDKGDLDGAIADYGQALLLNPGDASAWFN